MLANQTKNKLPTLRLFNRKGYQKILKNSKLYFFLKLHCCVGIYAISYIIFSAFDLCFRTFKVYLPLKNIFFI
jgi:hypothetical protein